MTIFDNKADFLTLGIEAVVPSIYGTNMSCTICLDTLEIIRTTTPPAGSAYHAHGSSQDEDASLHAAVRIKACNHVLGDECLTAWLEVGNTCPTCNRMLFVPPFEEPLTQDMVDDVIDSLRDVADEEIIGDALELAIIEDQATAVARRQQFEANVAAQREQTAAKDRERNDFLLNSDDMVDSDVEDWTGEDAEEDSDVGEDAEMDSDVEEL